MLQAATANQQAEGLLRVTVAADLANAVKKRSAIAGFANTTIASPGHLRAAADGVFEFEQRFENAGHTSSLKS